MQLKPTEFQITFYLERVLVDFAADVLKEKPDDIISHAAFYFTRLKQEKEGFPKEYLTPGIPMDALVSDLAVILGKRQSRRSSVFGGGGMVDTEDKDPDPYPKSPDDQRKTKSRIEDKDPDTYRKSTDDQRKIKSGIEDKDLDTYPKLKEEQRKTKSGIEDKDPDTYPKTKEEQRKIKSRIKDIFPFKTLEQPTLDVVIDAMRPMEFIEGQIIVEEEDGDSNLYYVLNRGKLNLMNIKENGVGDSVMRYENKGSFGESALLNYCPREFTVKTASNGSLWALSGTTYKSILVKINCEKLKKYLEFIEKVPELKGLTEDQKLRVCDAIENTFIQEGDVLFREGDLGNGMYFVENGTISTKSVTDDGAEEIKKISSGDYFGELALLNEDKRKATAKALEDCELAFLDKEAFERLMGPVRDILEKKTEAYKSHEKQPEKSKIEKKV